MPVRKITAVALGCLLVLGGCGHVERQMTIRSNPTGAVIYLNGEEIGTTPCTVDFTWYGNYDVIVRKDGYETLKTTQNVTAPWWQWIPFDLAAELTPGRKHDRHEYQFALTQQTAVSPSVLVDRAGSLKPMLESGEFTRRATTAPTSRPATEPAIAR